VYQLYLAHHEFVWERDPGRPRQEFVFAPLGDQTMIAAGATVRWSDPTVEIGLWRSSTEPTVTDSARPPGLPSP